MSLKSYTKEIFRPECNPGFESAHCIAHLDQDISGVLPYLKISALLNPGTVDLRRHYFVYGYDWLVMKTLG